MESLTTKQAADRAGWSAQKFHRLAARYGVNPVMEAPGLRGAKFWNPRDVERLIGRVIAKECLADREAPAS